MSIAAMACSRPDRRELSEEFFEGLAPFQVVEQRTDGYSGTGKNGSASENLRIAAPDLLPG